jgi:adenylate cyclase
MGEKIGDIDIDDLITHGLYDPDAEGAEDRLYSIRYVVSMGGTLDEMLEAKGDLYALGSRRLLRTGRARYTLGEAAELAGATPENALRFNRAAGFADPGPDARIFSDEDVELFGLLQGAAAFFGEDLLLQFVRVVGHAMSRVADAAISAFAININQQDHQTAVSPEELARSNEAAIGLLPSAVRAMDVLLRRHMERLSRNEVLTGDKWEGVDALDRAVGFCDLVGYTALSGQMSTTELAKLLARFEGRVADLVNQLGGSIIKLIGDEVMFIANDASTASEIALGLVEAFGSGDIPPVRVGVAAGRVLLREGDYYGSTVNLAARLVKLAPPGGVLAPSDFRELAATGVAFEDAGSPPLKGFEESVELVALHRS